MCKLCDHLSGHFSRGDRILAGNLVAHGHIFLPQESTSQRLDFDCSRSWRCLCCCVSAGTVAKAAEEMFVSSQCCYVAHLRLSSGFLCGECVARCLDDFGLVRVREICHYVCFSHTLLWIRYPCADQNDINDYIFSRIYPQRQMLCTSWIEFSNTESACFGGGIFWQSNLESVELFLNSTRDWHCWDWLLERHMDFSRHLHTSWSRKWPIEVNNIVTGCRVFHCRWLLLHLWNYSKKDWYTNV